MYSLFQFNMSIFKTKIIYFNRVKLTTVDLVLKTNDNNMKGGSTSVLYSTYRINEGETPPFGTQYSGGF